jgi:hypothetical protein
MKKYLKHRGFEITSFESLSNSSEMLIGGFSTAYAGGLSSTTLSKTIEANVGRDCKCTNTCNVVLGCGCSTTLKPA